MKPHAIVPRRLFFENHTYNAQQNANVAITVLQKIKIGLNKISPMHWYDGVWDNLDYKM